MPNAVHPTAVVAPGARLGAGVRVGPYAVVEDGVVAGEGTEIRAHAVLKRGTSLGRGITIHEGAVLGGEPQDLSFVDQPTGLVIGDGTRIREGVTVHRSTRPDSPTRVGSGCYLMAYAHVAHDCRIGDRVIIANNVALAGHVSIADQAFLSGGAGVHQFTRIGRLAMVGGNAKVVQDCLPFVITDGAPARAYGLNVVGLRRAGMSASQLRTLKEAYRILLRSGRPLEEALEALDRMNDALCAELAAFVRASQRGFAHAARDDE